MHPLGDVAIGDHLLGRDGDTLGSRIGRGIQPVDEPFRNAGAGYDTIDEAGILRRLEQEHPRQHGEAQGGGELLDKPAQRLRVHHHLRLHEAGAGGMFAAQTRHLAAPAAGLGIGGSAEEQIGTAIGQGALHRILSAVESGGHLQQTHRFQFVHRLGIRLIASPHRIAREAQHIANAQGVGPQQLRLQGNPVAVAAGELQHGFNAEIQQQPAHRQAAHAHHGPAAIGDIHRIHQRRQQGGGLQGAAGVGAAGRGYLRSDRESAAGQCFPKPHILSIRSGHHRAGRCLQ